jgi:hypothetical protein
MAFTLGPQDVADSGPHIVRQHKLGGEKTYPARRESGLGGAAVRAVDGQ